MKNKPFFLKNVQLSGYKSIKNVDIDFENGLNIIIGKNAAGKTNFLSFLNLIIDLKIIGIYKIVDEIEKQISELYFNFNSKLTFTKKSDEFIIISNNKFENKHSEFLIENKYLKNKKVINHSIKYFNFNSILINHGVPNDYVIVDEPYSFELSQEQIDGDLIKKTFNKIYPNFVKKLLNKFVLFDEGINVNRRRIDIILEDISMKLELLNNDLIKYSNIKNIRLSKNTNIFYNKETKTFTINNLFLEFKIEDSWLPFSDLSDGTKRLFYIISEVAIHTDINEDQLSIILLEEPELGIHPHQLHNLMQFLKEQAERKQIIISTHSPQVLNILDKNELNKIIIATSEGKKGTVLKHLTKKQKEKAKSYMEDVFLSDYWMYSDLEEQI